MDESRFGLMSVVRRCLTLKGVKPIIPYQHRFCNFYLFGGYSPVNGDSFTLELPYCDAFCFQIYLKAISDYKPSEFKILILDNGAFHKAQTLEVPKNVALLFLPPYSPELNPAEQIWDHIKDQLGNDVFDTLALLSDRVVEIVRAITPEIVESITGRDYYKNAYKECILS